MQRVTIYFGKISLPGTYPDVQLIIHTSPFLQAFHKINTPLLRNRRTEQHLQIMHKMPRGWKLIASHRMRGAGVGEDSMALIFNVSVSAVREELDARLSEKQLPAIAV